MTLTRATLGKLAKRATKEVTIGDHQVRLQRPSPLEFSDWVYGFTDKDGNADPNKYVEKLLQLVARMWIDEDGERLFKDHEVRELGSIDIDFYRQLSNECQAFATGVTREAKEVLGESETTTD